MRRALAIAFSAALVLLSGVPASATVTADFALGVLTVTGDGDGDTIRVECVGDNVQVNGSPPTGGSVGCSAVETLIVRAGGGSDRVDLSDVSRSAFPNLAEVAVFGDEGNDVLIGSDLADRLEGGAGGDELRGGDGADKLVPGGGGGAVVGGDGKDRVVMAGDGDWTINDERVVQITPTSEETTLQGVETASLNGGDGDNAISASTFSGAVVLDGGGGDDLMQSGKGKDLLLGKGGNDWLDSGAGNDVLEGKSGNDVLRGGEGNDQLRAGPGDDTCVGGPGADSELSC